MRFLQVILAIVLGLASTVQSKATDGVIVKSKNKDLSSNAVSDATVYVSDNKAIIITEGQKGSRILFDAGSEVFSYVDDNKKEYYQFDKVTLIQLKQQIRMFAQMMKQFAAQMPEQQRKKLDPFLNPGTTGAISYKQVSSEKIKNWPTAKYEGYQDDNMITEVNIATYQTLGISSSKFTVMKKMLSFAKENLQEIAVLLPAGESLTQFSFDEESPILRDGLPVKTIAYRNGSALNENIVESVALASIPDSQFDIPAGYTRKTIDIQNSLGRP